MSIGTYAELKTAIATWMHRSTLSDAQLADFVRIAEAKINRTLRLIHQETTTTITMTTGQSYDALPTGFLEVIDFYYNTDLSDLEHVPVATLNEQYKQLSSSRSQPRYFAITNRIEYDYAPDQAYATTMHYVKAWNIISDSTNWLLTNHPDVYLYNSLAAAEPYMKNDKRIPMWKALADEAMGEVQHLSSRARNAPLRVDPVLQSIPRGNIHTDY